MTKKRKNNSSDISENTFEKLSIQVSLNGLSFCVANTVSHNILYSDSIAFPEPVNSAVLETQLDLMFRKHQLHHKVFEEVTLVHKNTLFSLVPKALFDADILHEYLKFNGKIFATDALAYDEVENQDIVNVYVPYGGVNDYVFDAFGEFTFLHNGTVIIHAILSTYGKHKTPTCYAHVSKKQLDICVLEQKQLLLYNSFNYETKEDFAYYLLFVLEALQLDTHQVPVRLFGDIEEDDAIFQLCSNYIDNLLIFVPSSQQHLQLGEPEVARIDFTVLNTL